VRQRSASPCTPAPLNAVRPEVERATARGAALAPVSLQKIGQWERHRGARGAPHAVRRAQFAARRSLRAARGAQHAARGAQHAARSRTQDGV